MKTIDQSTMTDEVKVTATRLGGPDESEKVSVRVINPIFKNGKTYKEGSIIELHPQAAENFIRKGDVEAYEA